MPRPAHTAEQKQAIRNKIRAAASKLYREGNGKGVTARSVASEAGVSIGTLYAYFGSLSDVFQSLWREPTRSMVNRMTIISSEIDCPRTRLEALMRAYTEFAHDKASVFRNFFLYVRPENVPEPPQVPLEQDRFFQLYRTAIREGQRSGMFREGDLDQLTQVVISAVHGSLSLPSNLHRLALDRSPQIPELMISAVLSWLQDTD